MESESIHGLLDCVPFWTVQRCRHKIALSKPMRIPAAPNSPIRLDPWGRPVGSGVSSIAHHRLCPATSQDASLWREAMSIEDEQGGSPTKTPAPSRRGPRRCSQCNGRFGLVRQRLGLRQFCSIRCLDQYKVDIDRTTTRIKEWAHFLSRKL
jgi:hypothetical protein